MFKFCLNLLIFGAAIASAATFHVDIKGHGQPMILIPGLASSGEVWNSTVDRYSKDYECHVLTLSGFAGQPPVNNFSLTAVESDLSIYIAEHKLQSPVIVGHSLGGFLALSLAAHHPDQVGKLIIVDSLPALAASSNPAATPADLHNLGAQIKAQMLAAPEDQRIKMGRMSAEGMVTAPTDVDRVSAWSKATDWPTEVAAMSEMMGTDLRPELSKISAPVMVLGTWVSYGNETAVRQTFDTQYASLKGVKIMLAPKARHFIMYDDPQWLFAQMDGFLSAPQAR